MRPATKSSGQEYYEHALFYADDALVVSDEAEDIIRNQIRKYFVLKKGSIVLPTRHLGGSARIVLHNNMAEAWTFSSSQRVRAATNNVERCLKKKGLSFPKFCDSSLPTSCRLELDVTLDLSAEDASHFSHLLEF